MKNLIFSLIVSALLFASLGSTIEETSSSDKIRINQLGFYPNSMKQFLVTDTEAGTFQLIRPEGDVAYSGKLTDNGTWEASGENVMLGDFSSCETPGKYYIIVDGKIKSQPFEIKEGLYQEALQAAIKSYYFQRASMPIEETWGGICKRGAGHADEQCVFHPSSGHSEGTLNSPGGWYDAGDYGKYTVNASLSTGQMLHFVEQYPNAIADGSLNIPESGNGMSDLMDELKYELDWILTMQDQDGGVFHKVTAKNFSGFIMPADYDLERMVIGKGTAATLNFAAVMAQASRLYKDIDSQWSATALTAAEKAWKWAVENNNIAFKNPRDVRTGEYGDDLFSDDFYWAAAELFISTKKKEYLDHLASNEQEYTLQLTNSWKFFVRNNGFHSLLENRHLLDPELATSLKSGHLALADEILANIENHPYRIALDRFEWGSNSDMLNQAMILCIAHRLTDEEKYLAGAEQITDYIFGKNATGYCFLTGFGTKKVMFPHHRPSGADGIDEPVPGFIVGGPNGDRQDSYAVDYPSKYPAKSYMDVQESYASNEVCINWNAPAVFVLAYLQQVR